MIVTDVQNKKNNYTIRAEDGNYSVVIRYWKEDETPLEKLYYKYNEECITIDTKPNDPMLCKIVLENRIRKQGKPSLAYLQINPNNVVTFENFNRIMNMYKTGLDSMYEIIGIVQKYFHDAFGDVVKTQKEFHDAFSGIEKK